MTKLRGATTNLARWLETMYGLNAAEVSSVLVTAMVYDVAEVVDPQPHVVSKVPKSALAALKKSKRYAAGNEELRARRFRQLKSRASVYRS